ncbi:MAG: 2,3-bisphosphoglycerate-independent phosphoglycerate mutase [Nitrososphaerota archaeon]
MMKAVILIMDGLGDRPCKTLSGMTPLQIARKQLLDRLAVEGETGLVDVISPGLPNGSDTGHLAILGYNPFDNYPGRGPFEALGAGIDLRSGDVAFRCNFATVGPDGVIVDRRAGRITSEESAALARDLSEMSLPDHPDVRIIFKPTVEHRGVLVLRGSHLSPRVADTDPHQEGARVIEPNPMDSTEEARTTSEILITFLRKASQVLANHEINRKRIGSGLPPANHLILRGAGQFRALQPIQQRFGVGCAVVAGGALYRGVCRAAGFDVMDVAGATGTYDTDLGAKVQAVMSAVKSYDLVLLHVKATDTASHDRNPARKKEMIERVSQSLGPLYELAGSGEIYIAVTGDHTTPSEIGEHRGDPVPILIWGPDVRRDCVERFDEVSCSRGGLHRIRGVDIMPIISNYLGKMEMYGE